MATVDGFFFEKSGANASESEGRFVGTEDGTDNSGPTPSGPNDKSE